MQVVPLNARAPSTRRRRKEARPAELIDAAIEVFAEKGFAASRLEDVARRAGVSKGTAYLYFPNKEALFKAAVGEVIVTRIATGEREVEDWQGSTAELLRQVLQRWALVISSRRGGLLKLIVAEARNFRNSPPGTTPKSPSADSASFGPCCNAASSARNFAPSTSRRCH